MKKYTPFVLLGVITSIAGGSLTFKSKAEVVDAAISVSGCNYITTLPSAIDLNDTKDEDIRNYYSSLSSFEEGERSGTNLLKNLKPILSNMNYYSYDNVWKIYEITDRDWDLSPAEKDEYGDFNKDTNKYDKYVYSSSNSNTKNNPYVHTLYRDPANESGYIKEWGDHSVTGTNREHVWPQSRGFKAEKGAEGPAGTDIHHLKSGDATVNQKHHNNNPYGYVKENSAEYEQYNKDIPYIAGNKAGKAVHTFSQDESSIVFEPQDCDKGDIARACFYMVARYNNLSGHDDISQFEANLSLVNYATSDGKSMISTATNPGTLGILQDLLEWNKLDPVDEYEIHRNNLIYENYQGNRNPFIDFPQWADVIWGTVNDGVYDSTPKGSANPNSDLLNDNGIILSKTSLTLGVGESQTITAESIDGEDINWNLGGSDIVSLSKTKSSSGESVTITGNKAGKVSISLTSGEYSKTLFVTVDGETPAPDKVKDNGVIVIIIVAAIVAVVVVAVVVVIFAKSNKKTRRKIKSTVKKSVKKSAKSYAKSKK